MLAVDIEAFDPNLKDLGDGAIRDDGSLLMVGLYNGKKYEYFEPDHPKLKDKLASEEPKIFHNGVYDGSWLVCGTRFQFKIGGTWHDTMTRAALIDEYAELDLDSCCKRFRVPGKNSVDTIDTWWEANKKRFGLKGKIWASLDFVWTIKQGREAVVKYNKQDCIATHDLFHAQEPFIKTYSEPYDLECRSYPIVMEMKKNGIRLDTVERDRFTDFVTRKLKETETRLFNGYDINLETLASPLKLGKAMNALNIESPNKTAKGAPSWTADTLELIDHPVIPIIQEAKNFVSLRDKYLKRSLTNTLVGDRIHCTFSPNKRDSGGTRTGRYACANPNLQTIPVREEKHGQKSYGQEMRAMFLPEPGCMLASTDYSQIETVLLAHFAKGMQAKWFKDLILSGTNIFNVMQEMLSVDSKDVVKRMHYGFVYGMGIRKLIALNIRLFKTLSGNAGMDVYSYGKWLSDAYHEKFPVVRDTMRWAQNVTKQQGYVQSIGGRHHHKPKPMWLDGKWNDFLYKMLNSLIQGSAAEILKKGLLDAWEAGVFDILTLHLTVHDEIVPSVPYNKKGTAALQELNHIMTQAYKERLSIPTKVACEVGPNWGYWKSDIWEDMQKGIFNRDTITGEVLRVV